MACRRRSNAIVGVNCNPPRRFGVVTFALARVDSATATCFGADFETAFFVVEVCFAATARVLDFFAVFVLALGVDVVFAMSVTIP